MSGAKRVEFSVNSSWSARQIANEARKFAESLYRDRPEIVGMCQLVGHDVSETAFWRLLRPDERLLLGDAPVVVVPTGEFDVQTAPAPSGDGKYIVFDLCIVVELLDFLASLPGYHPGRWAACVLSGARRQATGPRTSPAAWVQDRLRELAGHLENQEGVPYSSSMLFGFEFAVNFLLGHEIGHHALEHFSEQRIGLDRNRATGPAGRHTASHQMEFAADAWSLNVISRLPAFELSSWVLSIEVMFLYLHLIATFDDRRRIIEGVSVPDSDHPLLIGRSERISRLGERVFQAACNDGGDLPKPLFNNLQDRQTVFASLRAFERYMPCLAECYCGDPDRTIHLHEAVRTGETDEAGYIAEMSAIESNLRVGSRLRAIKRTIDVIRHKLF
jgi:hypothetical protein